MKVIPFHVNHIELMQVQAAQRDELRAAPPAAFGDAWTAVADGLPIASAGLVDVWPGRAYAWALLGEDVGPWFVSVHRAVLKALARSPARRIEMAVDADFEAGARWAEMLGFKRETPEPMQAYLPNGRPAYLYARVH